MNWTILFRCLQIADDSSVPLVLEPLALKSVHVFCSQVEEPLQEKCVIQIDPVALVESVALAPLQLQVLIWIQKLSCRVERQINHCCQKLIPLFLGQVLNLFGLLADRRESWERMPREVVLCQHQEFVDQGLLLPFHPAAIGSTTSTCSSLQKREVVPEVLTRDQVNAP